MCKNNSGSDENVGLFDMRIFRRAKNKLNLSNGSQNHTHDFLFSTRFDADATTDLASISVLWRCSHISTGQPNLLAMAGRRKRAVTISRDQTTD